MARRQPGDIDHAWFNRGLGSIEYGIQVAIEDALRNSREARHSKVGSVTGANPEMQARHGPHHHIGSEPLTGMQGDRTCARRIRRIRIEGERVGHVERSGLLRRSGIGLGIVISGEA